MSFASPRPPAALTPESLLAHPGLHPVLRRQAEAFCLVQQQQPRLASVFATQQRWLMGHLAMALYWRSRRPDGTGGLYSAHVLDQVVRHQVASRNTAHAFLQEMIHYGVIEQQPASDRRFRRLEPAAATIAALERWVLIHLISLDALDGRARLAHYQAAGEAQGLVQPLIADGLMVTPALRAPDPTCALFLWLNQGGLVMDRLISSLEEQPADPARIRTGIQSIQELAQWLGLSRTHLARKMREAEAVGGIGWTEARGRSTLWISPAFRREYDRFQVAKLAVVDAALLAAGLGR